MRLRGLGCQYFGDNLETINDGDRVQLIGTVGHAFRVLSAGPEGRHPMQDILYLGLIVGFLALSWGLVELCDRL